MKLYGYPDIGRFGLGHSLLAWARCVVWGEKMGAKMIAPRWLKPRIGPYLRGERDKREYFKLFSNKGLIRDPVRSLILWTTSKTLSSDGFFDIDIYSEKFKQGKERHVVVFNNAGADNEKKHFSDIYGYSELLNTKLRQIVRKDYLPKNVAKGIAIHVRMGDFSPAVDQNTLEQNNSRLPIEWYCDALLELRRVLGIDVEAIVYSDGTDEELEPLLNLAHVNRVAKQESVTDLLSISEAPLLIASGSGFSLWGAFLGQVPTIHYPGRKIVPMLDNQKLEVTFKKGQSLPDVFVDHIRKNVL